MKMKMGLGLRIRIRMCKHREKTRVIQPDGQVRQVELPMSVGDLLRLHPHYYVKEAITRRTKFNASMIPMEAQLESGGIYLLLHLPRLFPSSSALTLPPPCACFPKDNQEQELEEERRAKCGPSIRMGKRRQCGLIFFTSCIAESYKVSPEGLGLGLEGSIRGGVMKRNKIWEPSLETILENEILCPQNSSRKDGDLVQERKPGHKRIEQRVPSSCCKKGNPKVSSSSFSSKPRLRTKKRDADANVIIL